MKSAKRDRQSALGYCLLSCAVLVGAGLVVGWPAVGGEFVGADDEYLILNHALVNHPSIAHAIKLFQIVHRDLYQPIPLLTFQIEFALHGGNVHIMHFTNVVIHIINGLLVWILLRRLTRSPNPTSQGAAGFSPRDAARLVPLAAALLFVVHPLSVECYAWLNGRMIMLSTTFTLASLILFERWSAQQTRHSDRVGGAGRAADTIAHLFLILLLAGLANMCKLRAMLPVLFVLVVLLKHSRWGQGLRRLVQSPRLWLVIMGVLAISVVFTSLNLQATQDSRMFEGARRQLQGPTPARVAMALAWYFQHYVWPTGLAPYYAPPPHVAWSDPAVLRALVVVAFVAGLTLLSLRWTRAGVVGAVWFLAMVATILPFIPARNLLVADRYVYLANIGLHWICAAAMLRLWRVMAGSRFRNLMRVPAVVVAGGALVVLVGASRGLTDYYDNNEARTARVIEISPNHPTLRTAWGWYRYRQGDYAGGVRLAEQELALFAEDDVGFYRAMNLRAMCRYRLDGDVAGAEADLRAAIARDPNYYKSYFRLGLIHFEQQRLPEAIAQLEIAVEKAPQFNPALNLLGQAYRKTDQPQRARQLYELAVERSSGYDVEAIQALGELDIEQGHYDQAVQRYRDLLAWHDGGAPARLNLALSLRLLERPDEAWNEYAEVLRRDPRNRRALVGLSDLLRAGGQYAQAVALWRPALANEPQAVELHAWLGLHQWYNREFADAKLSALKATRMKPEHEIAQLTLLLLAVVEGLPVAIADRTDAILVQAAGPDDLLFTYALEALESCTLLDAESPWPYYVTALLLARQGKAELARQVRQEFDRREVPQQWRDRLEKSCSELGETQPP